MSELYVLKYVSPIGEIEIQGTNEAVYSIMFSNRNELLTRAIEEVPIQVMQGANGEKNGCSSMRSVV
ncbi:hypothetical protein [Paenibacillus sp. FSL H7-0703]|uniref:hypothetical protein n=1 Tax=unclassified Paenibacillus TaxID=185978 RepID=UPI0030FA24C3